MLLAIYCRSIIYIIFLFLTFSILHLLYIQQLVELYMSFYFFLLLSEKAQQVFFIIII